MRFWWGLGPVGHVPVCICVYPVFVAERDAERYVYGVFLQQGGSHSDKVGVPCAGTTCPVGTDLDLPTITNPPMMCVSVLTVTCIYAPGAGGAGSHPPAGNSRRGQQGAGEVQGTAPVRAGAGGVWRSSSSNGNGNTAAGVTRV